ncbi:MAG: amidohydrolase family protein [Cyanobacteria bacterium J06635_15]
MTPLDLLITHATLPTGEIAAVGIRNGKIALIETSDRTLPPAAETLDINQQLLCPGFIDGHIHLDKTLMGAEWIPHIAGDTVRERIAIEKKVLSQVAVPMEQRAAALIEQVIRQGSTTVRTHVDVDPELGLSHLHTLLKLREHYADKLSIQIVAFPQSGVMTCPGTLDLLDQAIQAGADLVGGLDPAGIDNDITGQLDGLFTIAHRHGVGIDIHLHDPAELGIYQLQQIAQRTKALALSGRVTVSHAYALGMVNADLAKNTAETLADAGVSILTNAPGNQAFPPIQILRDAGVTVFAGSDNIRDAWWPFGDGDMLERAMIIAYRSSFCTDELLRIPFEMATQAGAEALGMKNYGLQVEAAADFVVLKAMTVAEAVVSRPQRSFVIKRGHIVAQANSMGG